MDPERLDLVERLFAQARELPVAERAAFLDERCAGDGEVRAEVESLLRHADDAFLEDPAHLRERTRPASDDPSAIGDYTILRILGRGGMGVVYLAEQQRPVRRKVALKLIKLGMDSEEVVARFDGERQALALMSHPNIAGVFHAGTSEQGRPYFVMEFVPGVPITEHCDAQRLNVADRLALYLEVCEAIQHAHQKGVIHRDIKASNVLVAFADSRAVPKIIDFGIAKATNQRLAEATVCTALGQILGTPEYMSPEQADLGAQDVDTRTDVYSLGVLLYELLVGAFPFDPVELRSAGFDELRRRIREEDPPTPSTRFHRLRDTSESVSRKRRTDPSSFERQLRGDLDWIVMKALEKDRARRYPSASELAADIRRYLADEPVAARPPGTLYRVGKFVRRHRLGAAAGAVVLAALVVAAVGSTVGLVRARRAERAARQAQQVAQREARTSQTLVDHLVRVFKVPRPDRPGASDVTVREVLDAEAARISGELQDEPEIRALFMQTIGTVYRNLGLLDEALRLQERALRIRRESAGIDPREVVDSLNEFGNLANQFGHYEDAARWLEEALGLAEQAYGPDSAAVATVLKNLGDTETKLGRLDAAWAHLERARRIRETEFGPEHELVAVALTSLANVRVAAGDLDEAIELHRRSLALRRAGEGPQTRRTAYGHYFLGDALLRAGRLGEARDELARALEIFEAVLDPGHGHVVECLYRLALATLRDGAAEQAEPLYRRALDLSAAAQPAGLDVVESLDAWVDFLSGRGRSGEAARARQLRDELAAQDSTPSTD